ncbi:rhodanese-like domain-containing protein [Thermogemmata fonticola]|jgi:rhodanese-related sulfurtransferase|uniref:Rhodanese-like domain-containing protein n=1 Tax=Thermogemmata fonticola TaxID=2755323 RepID=A0A7V8VCS1_9BACT|nr:rhodanese-like domain-containing protein [Thermogemmata fonticola]MBA2225634.1 rhodanese-like domain-containing protein [Thermogemmata fonticola]
MSLKTITPQELKELLAKGQPIRLIDVRTPAEYTEVHVQGARLVPLDKFDPQKVLAEYNGQSQEPIYVICRSGNRAKTACERLLNAGYANVFLVEGGTVACEQAGVPVVRGKRMVLSIERQTRIAIGTGVLAFTILGYLVHPAFLLGAAFFGAGLIFAGITDWCGMALLIARLPWNQCGGSCASAPASAASTTDSSAPASPSPATPLCSPQ